MDNFRDWFWEIRKKGQGPDYIFLATFDSGDAGQLAELVRQQPLPGFRQESEAKPSFFQSCANHISYIDEHTHERAEAARLVGEEVSIWYYTQIEVCNHNFMIQRVLSGSQHPNQPQTETSVIVALARFPKLRLVKWEVVYNGYSYGLVKSGTSAKELLAYLQR